VSGERRLYLFDIDGTLISTGGAGSSAMRLAFTALWRIPDGFNGVEFSGRTDRAIFRDALAANKLDNIDFRDSLRRFKRAYFRRLPHTLQEHDGNVLPGVEELVQELAADPRTAVSLGTGNFRWSAGKKLGYYGIDRYFQFGYGGFGDRMEDRASMIEEGIRSARRATGRPATVFVIGDTPHDIAAAKANKAVAVGVATGPASAEVLERAGADIVLATLEGAAKQLLPHP
jgi:phosphoglycolate phosphatase-like HAD superfamily hydrolase